MSGSQSFHLQKLFATELDGITSKERKDEKSSNLTGCWQRNAADQIKWQTFTTLYCLPLAQPAKVPTLKQGFQTYFSHRPRLKPGGP